MTAAQLTFDLAEHTDSFGDPMTAAERCPFCGDRWYLDVLEYWPEERAWMFDCCCEGAHDDACCWAAEEPREFGRWFEQQTGCPTRQGYRSQTDIGFLRLDFGLHVAPVAQKDAKAFISTHHRHNNAPAGWLFGAGAYNGDELVAVLWVGRPAARKLQDLHYCRECGAEKRKAKGQPAPICDCADPDAWLCPAMVPVVCEVNRLCVDPTLDPELVWNACSQLYTAAAREAKSRAYGRVVTYTLASESGGTLVAAGWKQTHRTDGGSWDRPSRRRTDKAPTCQKVRWERGLNKRYKKAVKRAAANL